MGVYPIKQLIIVRKDLGMPPGKMASQVAHASLAALLPYGDTTLLEDAVVREWLTGSFAKVVLAVNSEEELIECHLKAKVYGLPASYIVDSGVTVFNGVSTATCVGVGPAKAEILNQLFGHLELY